MTLFVYGTTAVGTPYPYSSINRPRTRVSVIPAAHLLTVLTVAGATIIASASGSTSFVAGTLVVAGDRLPGLRLQGGRVDELAPVRGGDHAHLPAVPMGQVDEDADVAGDR